MIRTARASAPHPLLPRLTRAWSLGILAAFGVVLALSWLLWSQTTGKVALASTANVRAAQTSDLVATLTRTGFTADGEQVEAILTTPTFFLLTQRETEEQSFGADRVVVFVVNETIHDGTLPDRFAPVLQLDGQRAYVPSDVRVIADAQHHRTNVVVYGDLATDVLDQGHTLDLLLPPAKNGTRATLEWFTPIDYPMSVQEPSRLSLGLIASLAAGLLAVLSPCLIQLTAFYLPTLTGVSVDGASTHQALPRQRRRVLRTALLFVAGFTIPYTLGGALMGALGEEITKSGLLSPRSPLTIGAGTLMIAMAVLVAYRARAPLVCKLPVPRSMQRSRRLAVVEPFLSGFAIATGCLACFGGAVFAVLLVYAGLLGSPALGALTLFLFSLGIAVPFLLAALSLSWVIPVTIKLQRATPTIGLVSAALMLFFGLTTVTGNFHAVSGWLFQHLPL